MAANSAKSTRNTVHFTTLSRPLPAASRTAARLSMTRAVCSLISPPTISPVAGSSPIWPAVKMRSPLAIAWLYGPMALGALSVVTVRRSIRLLLLRERGGDRSREHPIILRHDAAQIERCAFVNDTCHDRRVRAAQSGRDLARAAVACAYGNRA